MPCVRSLCVLCMVALGLLCLTSPGEGVFDCCYTYSKKPLRLKLIKGFAIQNSTEVCDIDAVILITKKFRVCANPKDRWVIDILKAFSTKRRRILAKRLKNKSGTLITRAADPSSP
ncbi:C-C motif chemokine 20-like [Rhinophrynus dorsalis]